LFPNGPLDRLVSGDGGAVLLGYNGDGARVKKTVGGTTTFYLVDDRNLTGYAEVVEEHQSVNGGAATLTAVYTHGLDLIAQRRSGSVRYFSYDGHGSTRLLTDASGAVTDTYLYDAYGTLLASTGSTPNNYLYCGEQFDPDLGMYYLRARFYQPQTGRFWTMDSWEGTQTDPLSLHKYLYAHNNPVMMVDPSGHDGNYISTLTAIGIALNIAYLAADSVSLAKNRASGNLRGAAVDSVNVAVDMALLVIPFSGPGAGLARAGGGVVQMAAATARSAGTNIRLAWAGIRSIVMFAQATSEGGNSSSSSSDSSSGSGGEPGSWQTVNESMPDRSRAYQAGITGRGANEVYVVNGVKFDGYKGGTLIEAKGPGYGAFVGPIGRFYRWFDEGAQALVGQARRQATAAGGKTIEWHVAEKEAADAIRNLLQDAGYGTIRVVHTP
jgi:RHS repeat-associated protein